jgi:hypothetical protein
VASVAGATETSADTRAVPSVIQVFLITMLSAKV